MTPLLSFRSTPIVRQCAWLFSCREAHFNDEPVKIRAVSPKRFERVPEQQMTLL